jgi:hypothetical protein
MVTFFAYFSTEEGLGAHPHDIEPVEFRVSIRPHTWGGEEWISGGAHCPLPTYVMSVSRVTAKSARTALVLERARRRCLHRVPMHLLVEEGKHALATTTFALVMAFIAARVAGDGPQVWVMPPVLLALLAVSYLTRPASRRLVSPSRL